MLLLALALLTPAYSAATITVSNKLAVPGQSFDMNISIDPQGTPIAGAQVDLAFDSSILRINRVTEGPLFNKKGGSTFFSSGVINNSAGTVVNIFNTIIGNSNTTTPGTFIVINITAIGSSGASGINLSNVKISDPFGNPVALNLTNGTVSINMIPQELVISNMTAASGKNYVRDTLAVGKYNYIDRNYKFSSVPSSFANLYYIMTANNDKASTGTSFFQFDVNMDVTVYVAHDDRITPKPAWLSSFRDTGNNLEGDGGTFSLYAGNFSAGHISLGGNYGDSSSMYNVVIAPRINKTILNNPPVLAAIGNKIINEGQTLTFTISAADRDGDVLSYKTARLPTGATFDQSTRVFRWIPGFTQAGTYQNVHFEVSDGKLADFENITITVLNINRAPTFTSTPSNGSLFMKNDLVKIKITAIDPDNDPLSYGIKIDGTQVSNSPSYNWSTNYTSPGYHNINLSVSDGSITVMKTITVFIGKPVQELVISNIRAASGKLYTLDKLGIAKLQYIDRKYIIESVLLRYSNLTYIMTANGDKAYADTPFLDFGVNQNVTIYVAYDDRITPKPSWIVSFADTGDNLVSEAGDFSIYAKNYTAGRISLGGNSGRGYSMYSVIIRPNEI